MLWLTRLVPARVSFLQASPTLLKKSPPESAIRHCNLLPESQRLPAAVARLIKAYGANEAELAIVISDDWQGKGLGTKLLRDLLEIGCTEGLERIVGYVLPENFVMQRICRRQGFEVRYDKSRDVFKAEVELRSSC